MRHLIIFFFVVQGVAQNHNDLPYYEIPEYTYEYTPASVAARTIDGLGFRYYWATDGLKDEDLAYKISEGSRTAGETVEHIYGLSKFIRNSILKDNKDNNKEKLSFEAVRKQTLLNLKLVSDTLKHNEASFDLNRIELPFWNLINGPIEDAVWHCGQIVMLRRASGNPFTSSISLFSGKVKNKN